MPAFPDPGGDSLLRKPAGLQLQVHHLDAIASSLPSTDTASIAQAAERRLEREIRAVRHQTIDLLQHESTRSDRRKPWIKRRQSGGDEVGIHKMDDLSAFR